MEQERRPYIKPSQLDMDYSYSDAHSDFYPVPSKERCLSTDNVSQFSNSPQSCFMYEGDVFSMEKPPQMKETCSQTESWRELPDLDSITGFPGDMSLTDSFNVFGDSGRDSLWGSQESDFFDIDVCSPLQNQDDISHGPTLAELNMEDSQPIIDSFYHPDLQKQMVSHSKMVSGQNRVSGNQALLTSDIDNKKTFQKLPKMEPLDVKVEKTEEEVTVKQIPIITKTEFPQEEQKPDVSVVRERCKLVKKEEERGQCISQRESRLTDYSSLFVSKANKTHTQTKRESGDTVLVVNESSMDRKWEEIKEFIHDSDESPSPTSLGRNGVRNNNGHDYMSTVFKYENNVNSPKESEEHDDDMESNDEGFASDHDDEMEEEEEGDMMEDEDDDDDDEDESDDEKDMRSSMHSGLSKKVGKSRRSDSEDMTPNPRRLLHIGNELRKLNKVISDLTPVSELPVNARQRSRKEKNKLASRACRLKKKAQHEANKVKLHGLDDEHHKLRHVLNTIRHEIVRRAQYPNEQQSDSLSERLDKLIKGGLGQMVAGHTPEFVNSVLEKTAAGSSSGGLTIKVK